MAIGLQSEVRFEKRDGYWTFAVADPHICSAGLVPPNGIVR